MKTNFYLKQAVKRKLLEKRGWAIGPALRAGGVALKAVPKAFKTWRAARAAKTAATAAPKVGILDKLNSPKTIAGTLVLGGAASLANKGVVAPAAAKTTRFNPNLLHG